MGRRRIDRRGRALLAGGAVLAALPALRMAQLVRTGSHLQYNDYWPMIATVLQPDGGLDVGGLFEFRNEHPVVVAKAMYWLNHQLTGGSNIYLGYAIVAVVGLQLVLLADMARSGISTRSRRIALVVAASALLFAPFGAWSFVKSMSGAAWLTANLFAVAAIWMRTRGRQLGSLPFGVLATMSYGTGLVVWPALLLSGWFHDRRLRSQWPTALAGAASAAWYLTNYLDTKSAENNRSSGVTVVRNGCQIIGSILLPTDADGAVRLGAAAVVALLAFVVVAVRRQGTAVAPWLGLGVMGVGSAMLIGFGRIERLPGNLVQSRYSSPAALVWIALLALVLLSLPKRSLSFLPVVAIAAAATLAGGSSVEALRATKPRQELLAIAMHLDLADGSNRWTFYGAFEPVTGLLRSTDHHPFDGRWGADCGLLGEQIPTPRSPVDPSSAAGVTTAIKPAEKVPGGTELVGWVSAARPVDCILVIDDDDRVVGAGVDGYDMAGPNRSSYRALAPAEDAATAAVVRFRGDRHFTLLEEQTDVEGTR